MASNINFQESVHFFVVFTWVVRNIWDNKGAGPLHQKANILKRSIFFTFFCKFFRQIV